MMLLEHSSRHHQQETAIMTFRLIRNLAFAVAALAIVFAASYTVEVQPVINALAH